MEWITSTCNLAVNYFTGNLKRIFIAIFSILLVSIGSFFWLKTASAFNSLNEKYTAELLSNKQLTTDKAVLSDKNRQLDQQRHDLTVTAHEAEKTINILLNELNKERVIAQQREQSLIDTEQELHTNIQKLKKLEALEHEKESEFAHCLTVNLPEQFIELLNNKSGD